MKYAWIHAHRELAPLAAMCEALSVSRSGYYDWQRRAPSQRECDDSRYATQIKESFDDAQACYGTRRLQADLAAEDMFLSRRRIGKLMQSEDLVCKTKKKLRPCTTDSDHDGPIAKNLLERCFEEAEPDRVYVGDITYIDTAEGWLYLAVWIDLCSRAVVGWSMQDNMRSGLVCDALCMALGARQCGAKTLGLWPEEAFGCTYGG